MKKSFLKTAAAFISAALIITAAPAALAAPYAPGDVDGDSSVTVSDARQALRIAIDLDEAAPGSAVFTAADVTGDNKITVEDARLILRAAIGMEKFGADLTSSEIYAKAEDFTVEISTEGVGFAGTGSGFFISTDGLIGTNFHVIANSTALKVTDKDGNEYDVTEIVAYDDNADVAIIRVDATDTPCATISSVYSTGDKIYTLGSSLGLSYTFSDGMISQAKREIPEYGDGVQFIQISAPISGGNSGGPLLDTNGNVIGINTLGYGEGQNLNFAVPAYLLNALDRSHPVSAEDYYYESANGIYAHANALKELCKNYGTPVSVEGINCLAITAPTGLRDTCGLYYFYEYEILALMHTNTQRTGSLFNRSSVVTQNMLTIGRTDEYDCTVYAISGTEELFGARYTVDGKTFGRSSTVSFDAIELGSEEDAPAYEKQAAGSVRTMLAYLRTLISTYRLDITMKDLGFANY